MKTLHLLRHAKSDWSDPTLPDHDRPLNERGKRTRRLLARHVTGWSVDLIVCSTAKRARQTAAPIVAVLACPLREEAALYAADVSDVLDVVRSLPDDARVVMLVGHNPSMEEVTDALCWSSPRYPTGALGTIAVAVDHWRDTSRGCGTVTAHVTPAELRARERAR